MNIKPTFYKRIATVTIPSFHLFGVMGFLAGTFTGLYLTYLSHLPMWVIGLMSLVGAIQLLLHTWIQKIITGKETLVYYRHEIGIMVLCAIVLWGIGQPVKSFLDISLLGVGVFLAFGRIGCYNVGCCHGKPSDAGVIYSSAHVKKGFPFYLAGVKIFPLPLVESLLVFITVFTGIWLMLQNYPPGTVLVLYTAFYGTVRYVLEFFRGDVGRPYWLGLSEAQWTTLLLVIITAVASFTGALPFYTWHIIIATLLIAISLFIIVTSGRRGSLILPAQAKQIAVALRKLHQEQYASVSGRNESNGIPVYTTKDGWSFSAGTIMQDGQLIKHYTVSAKQHSAFNRINPRRLARLIKQLERHTGTYEIRENGKGLVHIVFRDG